MSMTSFARTIAIPLAVLTLASCGTDDGGTDETHTSDGLTSPGATLDLGDTARVHLGDATADLTITSITKGDPADLARIHYHGADAETPYYVDYTLTLLSGSSEGGITMADYLQASGGGQPAPSLLVREAFPECQDKFLPANSTAEASVSPCLVFTTENGADPVDEIQFSNSDDYDVTDGDQVTWK